MGLEELATKVTVFLTPFLPYLVSGGEAMAKELGQRFGKSAIDKAKSLWDRLRPASEERAFKDAALALVEDPHSIHFQLALATAVGKYLTRHPEEVQRIIALISESKVVQSILVEREAEVGNILQEIGNASMQSNSIQEIVVGENASTGNLIQKR